MSIKTRVVISGLGLISTAGETLDDFWTNIVQGKSNISKIKAFSIKDLTTNYGAEIKNIKHMNFKKDLSRATNFAITAATAALKDAKLDMKIASKKAICIGLTTGDGEIINKICKKLIEKTALKDLGNLLQKHALFSIACELAKKINFSGRIVTIPVACSGGNHALIKAAELINAKEADIVIAGSSESLNPTTFFGFNSLRSLAKKIVSPFDRERTGILIGEGSGMVVVESLTHAQKRKAKIYAEITGYGTSNDAYHITSPLLNGIGIAKAISKALKVAGIKPNQVDYINAHGTGTKINDLAETNAIKKVFKKNAFTIPISSIKGTLGHCMGAASIFEIITCCLALKNNKIPPTINYRKPDPQCDLFYVPNKALNKKLNIVISNAFAFGGNNTCLVFKKYVK